MSTRKKLYLKKIARLVRGIQVKLVSDEIYLSRIFEKEKGYRPNLTEPRTFSEKLIYLMLHYRNPLENLCADKYYAQEYIRACGFDYILKPIYGVYRKAEDIDFESLPDEFFIKCNHASGNNMIINKKNNPDYNYLRKFFDELLKLKYQIVSREYQYENIKPLIICEKVLRDKNGHLPVDYKFYCFGGRPKYYMISYGEFDHKVRNHKFNMNNESIDYHFKKESTLPIEEVTWPDNFEEMVHIVEKLCKPFPHVRVDLYNVNGQIYFGELTFTSNGGVINVYDEEFEKEIGSWIDLDKYKADMIR